MKVYTSTTDLISQEIDPILATDPDLQDRSRELAEKVYAALDAKGLIVYEDGYDEATETFYLNNQGFRLNLNDDLEGSDFWDVVIDVLGEQ